MAFRPPIDPKGFLGKGLRFPLGVTAHGRLATSEYEPRIEESIRFILGTAPGERVMRPDFGCGIHDLVFAPDNPGTVGLVADEVRRALVRFEPRVDVLEVRAESVEGQRELLLIHVDYRIRANNTIENLVYPFYITEGA
jgi:phage baseplate assembly protein W